MVKGRQAPNGGPLTTTSNRLRRQSSFGIMLKKRVQAEYVGAHKIHMRIVLYLILTAGIVLAGYLTLSSLNTAYKDHRRVYADTLVDDYFRRTTMALAQSQHIVSNYVEDLRSFWDASYEQWGKPPSYEAFKHFPRRYEDRPEADTILAHTWAPRIVDDQRAELEEAGAGLYGVEVYKYVKRATGPGRPMIERENVTEYSPFLYFYPIEGNTVMAGFDVASNPPRWASLEASASVDRPSVSPTIPLHDGSRVAGVFCSMAVFKDPLNPNCTLEMQTGALSECLWGHVNVVIRLEDLVVSSLRVWTEKMRETLYIRYYQIQGDKDVFVMDYGGAWAKPGPLETAEDVAARSLSSRAEVTEWGGKEWKLEMFASPAAQDTVVERDVSRLRVLFLVTGGAVLCMITVAVALLERQRRLLAANRVVTEEYRIAKDEAIRSGRAKQDFLANMSHEIRTPISGIINCAELFALTADPADPEKRPRKSQLDNEDFAEGVLTITACSQALLGLINNILDMAKIDSGKMQLRRREFALYDLEIASAAVVRQRAETQGVQLHSAPSRDSPIVVGDFDRLRQVIVNLLSNAVKFTSLGGLVELTVALDGGEERRVSAKDAYNTRCTEDESDLEYLQELDLAPPGPGEWTGNDKNGEDAAPKDVTWLRMRVTDTGIGMDEDTQKRLFSAFMQADSSTSKQYGGTGLGLAISQMLVSKMGGEVEVTSALGVGSTFTAWIPVLVVYRPLPPRKQGRALGGARLGILSEEPTRKGPAPPPSWDWGLRSHHVRLSETYEGADVADLEGRSSDEFRVSIGDFISPSRESLEDPGGAKHPRVSFGAPAGAGATRSPRVSFGALPRKSLTFPRNAGSAFSFTREGATSQWNIDSTSSVSMDAVVRVDSKIARRNSLTSDSWAFVLDSYGRSSEGSSCGVVEEGPPAPGGASGGEGAEVDEPQPPIPLSSVGAILVVDDSEINLRVQAKLLSRCGYRVETADGGARACEMAADQKYAVIFMDIQMPGVDGYMATANIRRELGPNQHTPIVALSANAVYDVEEKCIEGGMSGYMSKPTRQETMVRCICRWTGSEPPPGFSLVG